MFYIRFPKLHEIRNPKLMAMWGRGLFRNSPAVVPGRWGFYFYGFEFGSRNPGDPVGVWLKRLGIWRC
jgi:hypothetical protein